MRRRSWNGYSHEQWYSQISSPRERHFVSRTSTLLPPDNSMARWCQPTTVRQSPGVDGGASEVVSVADVSPVLSYVRRPSP